MLPVREPLAAGAACPHRALFSHAFPGYNPRRVASSPFSPGVWRRKDWRMTRTVGWVLLALAFLVLADFGARAEPPESAFKVLKKIPVGGDGGWDYLTLDAAGRRLYIARSNRVTVVDVEEGKVVCEAANTPGVHGVALDLKRTK